MIEAMLAGGMTVQDNRMLAVRYGTAVSVYSTEDYSKLADVTGVVGSIYQRAFKASPDGRYIASGAASAPYLTIIDTATWQVVSAPIMPNVVLSLEFSPDGNHLWSCVSGNGIRRVNLGTMTIDASPVTTGSFNDISCSPDGKYIAYTSGSTISLLDAATLASAGQSASVGGTGSIYSCAFSPDSQHIAVTGSNYLRIARVSDLALQPTGSSTRSSRGELVRWHPNGSRIVVSGYQTTDATLTFYSFAGFGQTPAGASLKPPAMLSTKQAACYSPTGDCFAAIDGNYVYVWTRSDDPTPVASKSLLVTAEPSGCILF